MELTPELLRKAFDDIAQQPPRRGCQHLHSASYVRRLREQGVERVRCLSCGAMVRP